MGAWPILPCAGLELAALALAFYLVSRHDGDYERLTISDSTVCLERSDGGEITRREFNRDWAQLVCRTQGSQCRLALRSHGKETPLGNHMNDEGRLSLARELKEKLRWVEN